VASRLRAHLDAYTSPRRTALVAASGSEVDMLPLARRRGEAFCALLEHMPSNRLPQHGGSATSVMVMVDLATLRSELGLAENSTGETITAAEARRLACTAGILPVVLGGTSEILDLGRSHRLCSPPQRKALDVRDRRCRGDGCEIPQPGARPTTRRSPGPPVVVRTSATSSCSRAPPPPPRPLPHRTPPQRRRPLHPPHLTGAAGGHSKAHALA